jgi:hypothetical protein
MATKKLKNTLYLNKKKYKMSSKNTTILNYINSTIDNPPNRIITLGCTNDDGISIVHGLIKNQNDGTQALTTSIQYDASDNNSMSKAIQDIYEFYTNISNSYPNVVWIYTALNVNSYIEANVSHQNWICYNMKTNTLYRFEPSVDYPEFRFEEFCTYIVNTLSGRLVQDVAELNHHNMCKAYSTLMIIYFILTRDYITLTDSQNTNAIILDTIIKDLNKKFNMRNYPHPRKTRTNIGYIVY